MSIKGGLKAVSLDYRRGQDPAIALAKIPEEAAKLRAQVASAIEALDAMETVPNEPRGIGIAAVHYNPWKTYFEYVLEHPDGLVEIQPLLRGAPGAGVLAIQDGDALLVRNWRFRPNAAQWQIELPRGTCKQGESIETGVIRELGQEFGAKPGPNSQLVNMGPFSGGPAIQAQIDELLFVDNCLVDDSLRKLDANEKMEPHRVPLSNLMEEASRSVDGFLHAAIFRALALKLVTL